MLFRHVLTLTASVGLVSAKCGTKVTTSTFSTAGVETSGSSSSSSSSSSSGSANTGLYTSTASGSSSSSQTSTGLASSASSSTSSSGTLTSLATSTSSSSGSVSSGAASTVSSQSSSSSSSGFESTSTVSSTVGSSSTVSTSSAPSSTVSVTPQCGVAGTPGSAFLTSDQPTFITPEQCGALCRSQDACHSYATDGENCYLYSQPVESNSGSSPSINLFDRACATSTQICSAFGSRPLLDIPLKSSTSFADASFTGCAALCNSTSGCESYSIQIETGGACSLYSDALTDGFTPDDTSSTLFWDADCAHGAVAGPSLAPPVEASTLTSAALPSHPTAVATFTPYVAPVLATSDSPPYTPSGPQQTPTNVDQFKATYTYTQYPLTMISTGSPPITTGIAPPAESDLPPLPCVVSTGPQAQFSVLNENYVPMVSRTNSIGPLLQPTAPPAAGDPILDPSTFTLPTFYLSQPAGVSDAYDLIYDGATTQYVGMTITGAVVLVDASTGEDFGLDGVATTIFNVNCYGLLTVTLNGQDYTWSTNGDSCSMTPASPAAKNMKALPVNNPEVQNALKDRKRSEEMLNALVKRAQLEGRDLNLRTNANFDAPQCPSTPAGLVSETKQNYQMDQGNLCDAMSDYWQLSPFDFGDACDIQSLCYDQCEHFSWVGCNAIFSYAALFSCADNFKEWYEVVEAVACAAQAVYFTAVAFTDTGRKAYYNAQDAMCACFCTDPPETCVYNDGSFYCADLYGSDNNNCGACGGQCGAGSACHSGKCGCPHDQCGDTCLDFRNNPNNCGSCGNVCDPPYCIGGQCYAPAPDQCAPDQPVTNFNFSDYQYGWTNWTFAAFPQCQLGTNITLTPSYYTPQSGQPVISLGVDMNELPAAGCQMALSQANVKMCPGFQYELTFSMGYVNEVGNSMVISNADCTVRWLTGTPDQWNDNDGYQTSPSYSIGASNPTYETFGPWSFNVAAGQHGVVQTGPNLYIDLTAVLACNTPLNGTGRFIITFIQLEPVGAATTSKRAAAGLDAFLLDERDPATIVNALEPYYPDITEPEIVGYKAQPRIRGRTSKGY